MRKNLTRVKGGITAPNGFRAAGIHSGIKAPPVLDLALLCSEREGPMAGVFTNNQVQAAPVMLGKQQLKAQRGQAIIINSGNANACTGAQGITDAKEIRALTARHLQIPSRLVYVGSTGIIGRTLPMTALRQGIPHLVAHLHRRNHRQAATAIMTTDTTPKEIAFRTSIGRSVITVGGMAKGSGMIHPNMATMLAYLTTDAAITPPALQRGLVQAVNQTFNCISVDGDSSTNDTVLCLSNGLANNPVIQWRTPEWDAFQTILQEACQSLALQICRDGEGATKLATIVVKGTRSNRDAQRIAQTVATSLLVKTALFGEDPNWGRIVAAVGRAGVPLNAKSIHVQFDGIAVVKKGERVGTQADHRAQRVMKKKEFTISISVGRGRGLYRLWTTDLSYDYVKINASYTT